MLQNFFSVYFQSKNQALRRHWHKLRRKKFYNINTCGLYNKTFYGRNCCCIVISQSVDNCYSPTPQSNIWRQGQEPTIRVESHKMLHSGKLQLCSQVQTRVYVTDMDKHTRILQHSYNYGRIRFIVQTPSLTHKYQTRAEVTFNGKHSSLRRP